MTRFWTERVQDLVGGGQRRVELAATFRQLAVMMAAGVPIAEAVRLVAGHLQDRRLRDAFVASALALHAGKALSAGLRPNEDVFGSITLRLVEVGETSGRLPVILDRIATFMERDMRLRMRVKSALTYPMFMFAGMLVFILLIPPLLLNGLFDTMRAMHAEVPPLTRCLMVISSALRSPLTYAVGAAGLAGAVALYARWERSEDHRLLRDRLLLRVPILGPTLRFVALANFCRSLDVTYASGIPILTGLRHAAGSCGNLELARGVDAAIQEVSGGGALHQAFARLDVFPPALVNMLAAAEERGDPSIALRHFSRLAESEVEHRVEIAVAALEPLMLLVMGCLAGGTALATLAPMLRFLESLSL